MRCSERETENHSLMRRDARVGEQPLELRSLVHEQLVLGVGAESHYPLDPSPVVPRPVEEHDLACGREVGHVPLEIPLAALAFGRLLERHHREPRGFRCSVKRLMVPPLPAASRPSNRMTMRVPESFTQFCSFSSSIWRKRFSTS